MLAACRVGFDPVAGDADVPADVLGFAIDATIYADGVVAEPCGATVLMQDGFDDATPAPLFFSYTNSGLTLRETAGRFEVVFGANVGSDRYAGYKTVTTYPVDGLCGVAEVAQVPSGEGIAFYKWWSSAQQVEFIVYRGRLEFRTHLNRAVATLSSVSFDPVQHRFLRLRHQGGVTSWDTSMDGVTFVKQTSTTFLTQTALAFEVGGGAIGAVSNGGVAAFERALVTGP